MGRYKSGRIKKIWFSLMCVWLGLEKWESRKLFCLVGEKKGMMEKVVYII